MRPFREHVAIAIDGGSIRRVMVARAYVDGDVGSYANPCYLAAYEARLCLGWEPRETTLISLGAGRFPGTSLPPDPNRLRAWEWLGPFLGAFLQSVDEQQVHLGRTFFEELDFRRLQVNLAQPIDIDLDDAGQIPQLTCYGDELGRTILNGEMDGV